MSNQHPAFNPYMYSFPFPYPPHPFMNPMMPHQARNMSVPNMGESMPPKKAFPAVPYGYPPYPMMYPPSPYPFFPFYEPKTPARDVEYLRVADMSKESFCSIPESKKVKGGQTFVSEKKQTPLIGPSDDESKREQKLQKPVVQKQSLQRQVVSQKELQVESKPRRTERKIIPSVRQDPPAAKLRVKQKKKQLLQQQKKSKPEKPVEKQTKILAETTIQNQNQTCNRSTRTRFLTAKDGKGKIMIGDEFQANLPIFLPRNEVVTVWIDSRKTGLLSRFLKPKHQYYS